MIKAICKVLLFYFDLILTFSIGGIGLQAMLDKIKSKVTNPRLKGNFTLTNIANFFASFISGNEFLNNLEVLGSIKLNRTIIDELNVHNVANIEELITNNFNSQSLNISKNEISFNPYAQVKLKNSNIVIDILDKVKVFHAKDIFEVIAFMKYIVKICGNKLEKCDFRNILLNNKTRKNPNKFNETTFKKNITEEFDKKLNDKFKELELRFTKEKQEIEEKLKKRFEAESKKKDEEIKKLQDELKKEIKIEIPLAMKEAKATTNLRKNLNQIKTINQKFIEIGQKSKPFIRNSNSHVDSEEYNNLISNYTN